MELAGQGPPRLSGWFMIPMPIVQRKRRRGKTAEVQMVVGKVALKEEHLNDGSKQKSISIRRYQVS